jgi:hypothetical protein
LTASNLPLQLCPCCGKNTLNESGRYEICPECWWEDDPVQSDDPDYAGGANRKSLKQARLDYLSRGGKTF